MHMRDKTVGSILRHGEDGAGRCDTAQRMRSERDQRHIGFGGERARDQDGLAERPAEPFEPADQINGGTDRREIQPVGGTDIAPEYLAEVQGDAEG